MCIKANLLLNDPTKEIEKGDVVLISLASGMVFAATYRGVTNDGDIILQNPSVIQNKPVMVKGETQLQLYFSLMIPDTTCKYRIRYSVININNVIAVEIPSNDIESSYTSFAVQVEEQIFAKNMTEQEMKEQDDFYDSVVMG